MPLHQTDYLLIPDLIQRERNVTDFRKIYLLKINASDGTVVHCTVIQPEGSNID